MLRRSHFNGSIDRGGELGGSAIGAPSAAPPRPSRRWQIDPAMTFTRGVLSLTTAVLLLAVVAACGSDPDQKSTPSPSPTPTASPAETSSSPASPENAAAADAQSIVTDYYAITDLLLQDATVPLNRLEEVAASTQLSAQDKFLSAERTAGTQQRGDTLIVETKVQAVSLDNSDPKSGHVPTVTVDVCWDVSGVDVLDASGKSIIPSDRPDRGWTRLTVANYSWDSDPETGWRVAGGEDLEKKPCAG